MRLWRRSLTTSAWWPPTRRGEPDLQGAAAAAAPGERDAPHPGGAGGPAAAEVHHGGVRAGSGDPDVNATSGNCCERCARVVPEHLRGGRQRGVVLGGLPLGPGGLEHARGGADHRPGEAELLPGGASGAARQLSEERVPGGGGGRGRAALRADAGEPGHGDQQQPAAVEDRATDVPGAAGSLALHGGGDPVRPQVLRLGGGAAGDVQPPGAADGADGLAPRVLPPISAGVLQLHRGRRLMLGDQFAIYGADLDLIGLHDVEDSIQERQERDPEHQAPAHHHPGASDPHHGPEHGLEELRVSAEEGQGLAALPGDGTFVAEHSLRSHKYVKTWALSRTLPHKRLEAIQAVEGAEAAECSSGGAGFVDHGWLLFAATDSGQVVTLCPTFRGELHPLHMVISLRRRKAAKEVTEVVDSHTGTAKASSQKIIAMARDSRGFFWLLETHTEGHAEVRALDLDKGSEVGRWVLPSGRWWVPGMCQLAEGQGFLLAAAADTNRGGQVGGPEIWRLVPS
ncbi:unnamed protein product [Effrenium voratum]|nr:unnamed protein product [Effrenium voratum]